MSMVVDTLSFFLTDSLEFSSYYFMGLYKFLLSGPRFFLLDLVRGDTVVKVKKHKNENIDNGENNSVRLIREPEVWNETPTKYGMKINLEN